MFSSLTGWLSSGSSSGKHSNNTIDSGISKEERLVGPKKEGDHGKMDDHKQTVENLQAEVTENKEASEVARQTHSSRSSSRRDTLEIARPQTRSQDEHAHYDHERQSSHRRTIQDREQGKLRDMARNIEDLKQRLQESQKDLVEANRKIKDHENTIKAVQHERNNLSTRLHAQVTQQTEKTGLAERRVAEVEELNKKQERELLNLRGKLHALEDKQSRMASLLDERTSDLKGVQPFLTTADRYSGAEIIKMVEGLNAEIFQAAAFMAELVVDDSMIASKEEYAHHIDHYKEVLDSIKKEIGNELFTYLANNAGEVRLDPLPLQLGLQHLFTVWCAGNIESFASGQLGKELGNLYKRIRTSEIQAIAGRWRTITSSQMRNEVHGQDPHTIIFSMTSVLLFLCGWSWLSKGSQKSVPTIHKKISAIEEQYKRLKAAVKEGITTSDMDVVYAVAGTEFSENMADYYADAIDGSAATARKEPVLCTVAMGLQKTLIRRGANGEVDLQKDVLVKPKVALVSVLQEENHEESTHSKTAPQQPPTESLPQHSQDGK